MATYFISDLHLEKIESSISTIFSEFLERLDEDDQLYILGDLFESWIGDDNVSELSAFVGNILAKEIKDIKIVRNDKISHWRDTNGWDSLDFAEIGEGVKADKVIGIELGNFSLRDGPTLYCGTSDVTITVIDVATGEVDFTKLLEEYRYPTMAGQHTSETTESRFRKLYLQTLAEEIGRSFHPYDMADRVAADSRIASS
mgnify:CR=1 FL=1